MFCPQIASFVPYQNREVLDRVRRLSGKELERHANPAFRIRIVSDATAIWVADMVARIQESDRLNRRCTMILPNPCPVVYESVAEVINLLRIQCRNLHVFTMDEWADGQGNVAPPDYRAGFTYSQLKYFYGKIDPELRMPLNQIHYPTTRNIRDYSRLLEEAGGADVCYSGPGWSGHIAFIDPQTPEFGQPDVETFMRMESRIVTLHPMTVMQNSLHGVFGQSGDLAAVPSHAATIGPVDVVRARTRVEIHGLTTGGSFSSWQRMVSRLILHGEVTPLVPASILQLLPTNVYVSEEIAKPIVCMERAGY